MAGTLTLAGFFLLTTAPARAEVDLGVRGGFYNDADAGFLGVELLTGVTRQIYFNPNLEYVFVDQGDLATVNLDFHYDFETTGPYYLWAGGGPAVIFSDREVRRGNRFESEDETDVGLNVLGGVGFGRGGAFRPYVQGKLTLSDETEASIAFGIRFH
jgi:hypothetical protein